MDTLNAGLAYICIQLALVVSIDYNAVVSVFVTITGCCLGPSCSKLTISLVNVSLKFQILLSEKMPKCFVEKT